MKTKYFLRCLFGAFLISTACYGNVVIENQTIHPLKDQKSKIAIQWATSAKEVDEANKAIMYGNNLNSETFLFLTQPGKNEVKLPEKAQSFRVVVWTTKAVQPDFLTNWVDIVPDKKYILRPDHLVPSVLMSGTGC